MLVVLEIPALKSEERFAVLLSLLDRKAVERDSAEDWAGGTAAAFTLDAYENGLSGFQRRELKADNVPVLRALRQSG